MTTSGEPQGWSAPLALSTVAEGECQDGCRWAVRAGGMTEDYRTRMEIVLPDGRLAGGGGMAGPALPAGRLVNLSIHRWEASLHYLVARVHPTVKRLHLEFDYGFPEGMDLHPVAELMNPDLSIMAAILPNSPDVTNISAWDNEGRRVDERRTDRYGRLSKRARMGHNAANDEDGDRWEPAP